MPKKKKKKKVNEIVDEWPRLSVLTPLYNRNKWLPLMLSNIIHFDYPKEKIEWFILDSKDGDEDVKLIPNEFTKENIEKMIHPIKLRYEYLPRKMTIAEKRTYLSKNMSHPWFANMDSDDIYMDCFLKYGVNLCKKNKVGLCGSPQMIFVYPHLEYRVTAIQCGAARQMHEATMIGTKKYLKSMNYYTRNDEKGEGASLVDGNDMNVVKSECSLCMICVCHNTNTCNKDAFEEVNVQSASITGIKREILGDIMTKEINEGKENNSKFTIPKPEIPDPQAEKYKNDKLKEDHSKQLPPNDD